MIFGFERCDFAEFLTVSGARFRMGKKRSVSFEPFIVCEAHETVFHENQMIWFCRFGTLKEAICERFCSKSHYHKNQCLHLYAFVQNLGSLHRWVLTLSERSESRMNEHE